MYEFDIKVLIDALPAIINGIKITLIISGISSCLAFIIGICTAYLRTLNNQAVKFLTSSYVELIRNTPFLIQLYIWYKGFPCIGLNIPPLICGISALSLYTGAFISEVLRSGINSIAHQQHEAAKGLGLSEMQTFRLIIFPQAIRIIIPPLGSQFINLIKNSSLVSFISVSDLFYVIYKGAVDDFRFFEFFIAGALVYMLLTGSVALITNILENRFQMPGRAVKI